MLKIEEAINQFSEKKISDLIKNLDANNKTATGRLNQSLKYVINSNPESMQFIIQFFGEHYLHNVAYGRKPGTYPNIDNLKDWCIARNIPLSKLYIIAKRIFENGIEPDSSLSDALSNESFADFGGILQGEVVQELRNQFSLFIQEFNKIK